MLFFSFPQDYCRLWHILASCPNFNILTLHVNQLFRMKGYYSWKLRLFFLKNILKEQKKCVQLDYVGKKRHCMKIINKVKSVLLPDTLESRAIRVSQQGDR